MEIDRFCFFSFQMASCCITVRILFLIIVYLRSTRIYWKCSCFDEYKQNAAFLRLSYFNKVAAPATLFYRCAGWIIVDAFDPSVYKICCEMGEENATRSCAVRAYSIELKECRKVFWECCKRKYGAKGKNVRDWLEEAILPSFLRYTKLLLNSIEKPNLQG